MQWGGGIREFLFTFLCCTFSDISVLVCAFLGKVSTIRSFTVSLFLHLNSQPFEQNVVFAFLGLPKRSLWILLVIRHTYINFFPEIKKIHMHPLNCD